MQRTINYPSANHMRAIQERGDGFAQFVRNGVWGACTDCPRDTQGNAYPEFCEYGDRYDHHLTLSDLVDTYKAHSR